MTIAKRPTSAANYGNQRCRYVGHPKGNRHTQIKRRPVPPPVRHIRHKFNPTINVVVRDEVEKLLENSSIRESKHPKWVANIVMVKKKNGKWQMHMDFTDLNKACLKDSFPLPHIDQFINATAGNELLSFLDTYSGYNQILMEEEDQKKTTFITYQGTYCYSVMPFGLKNAGPTYQRLVTKMFKDQIGKTMEVHIDDMLVKSVKVEDHIDHLKEVFDILRRYGMKLNPEKCAFGVASGMFLGFFVLQ
uniref:RNA-directed DNA polymerase homolog n=1 Tax=Nicotiana tabacum TaxID=4097 RepID=A0A1S4BX26_TOBAC|nr:PREDICTED: RNA-directed DNA polymerase homolog [Nicotiana tabacum]